MPNEIHEVNMQAQDFQNPKPKDKEMPSQQDTKWRNHHLEDIYLKDTSRNEISIETRKKRDVKLPKERMVSNKPSALQSFMMAQSTKKKRFAFHQHTLDMDKKMSILRKIGQLPQELCIKENLHLNTKCTRWDHHFH